MEGGWSAGYGCGDYYFAVLSFEAEMNSVEDSFEDSLKDSFKDYLKDYFNDYWKDYV